MTGVGSQQTQIQPGDRAGALDIGVVTGSLSPAGGGLFECMRVPTNLVAQRGAQVSVYGLIDDQFEESRPAWTVNQLQAYGIVGPRRFGYAPGLNRALGSADHDVVHLHGIWFYPSYATSAWRRRTSRPIVVSPVGMLDEWSLRQSALKKRVIRRLYEDENLRRAAVIHANSAVEVRVIRNFGLSNPIAVMPNGIDLPDLSKTPSCPQVLSGGRRTLLFLGRMHAKKGLRELVDAWARLRDIKPQIYKDWRVIAAGWDDGFRRDAEALVAARSMGDSVTFLGPVFGGEKAALLAHADAFVLPSHGEGMPMAVLEAWAYARPVFMTAACNLTDSFAANAAVEIVVDPDQMASTFAGILDDSVRLESVGAAGRRFAEQRHSWPVIVDSYVKVYDWVVNGGEMPACVNT